MLPRHALAFLTGILCVEHSSGMEGFRHAAPLLVGVVLLCGIWGAQLVGWCAAGTLWALVCALTLLSHQLPPEQDGTDWLLRGDVVSFPRWRRAETRFNLRRTRSPASHASSSLRGSTQRHRHALPSAGSCACGCAVREGFANPGGFDYEGSLFRDGIGATGYVRNSVDNLKLTDARAGTSWCSRSVPPSRGTSTRYCPAARPQV